MTTTDDLCREARAEKIRTRRKKEREKVKANRMSAAEFARLHGVSGWVLRERMRKAGVRRQGGYHYPVKVLEKFLVEMTGGGE